MKHLVKVVLAGTMLTLLVLAGTGGIVLLCYWNEAVAIASVCIAMWLVFTWVAYKVQITVTFGEKDDPSR